jgi:hypothetical protein
MILANRDIPLSDYIPRVVPNHWRVLDAFGDGYRYLTRDGLRVIASTGEYDGREWMHVSMSRADRLPSYEDMKHVKEVIVGNDRWAAQLFPPIDQHVNIHQFCLHLWFPLTGSLPWPNFGEGGTI